MSTASDVRLRDVQDVYSGPEGRLWHLIMGEQVHIGGLASSMDLAERAQIQPGTHGVDFCCCTGAGMRFLIRFREVGSMTGVDATEAMVEQGRRISNEEGLGGRTAFRLAEVTDSGIDDEAADFVWGEDAWCYVDDKPRMIAEAARIVKPGGVIAFTDWVYGDNEPTQEEKARLQRFMKFPNVETIPGYCRLLEDAGLTVECADNTRRFAAHVDLYMKMLEMQLTYDALKIIGFDAQVFKGLAGEMASMKNLATDGKIVQGRFVARKA